MCPFRFTIPAQITYFDWTRGQPLLFYLKFPGGVPGLGKEIPGDNGDWEYSVRVAFFSSAPCQIYDGYPDRLYCSISSIPKEYENTSNPITLSLNGCDIPVFETITYLPVTIIGGSESSSSGESGGGSGSGNDPSTEYGGSCSVNSSQLYCEGYGGTYTSYCICP